MSICGCNSDPLDFIADGAAQLDRSLGPTVDIATANPVDLAVSDRAMPPTMWIREFGTAQPERANVVAADRSGNAYVAGYTMGGGLDGNRNAGGYDVFLARYEMYGDRVWLRQFGTAGDDDAYGVATDAAANVYVTGWTTGGLDGNGNAGGPGDAFLVKYDANGNKLWTRQFGSALLDVGAGVATDGAGNAYVAGFTQGALDGNRNAGGLDAFLVKYDPNGNRLWSRQVGSELSDYASGVATDGMGNAYVAGYTLGGGLDGNRNAGVGSSDGFVVKYDTNGSKLWLHQFGTATDDEAYGVATDGSGNVYVTGCTKGGLGGNGNAGGYDFFLVTYDANGGNVRLRQFGTNDDDCAKAVATDGEQKVYVSGWTRSWLDSRTVHDMDAFLVQYDPTKNNASTRQLGTRSIDCGLGVAYGMGGIYVAGYTLGALDGNQNAGDFDAFLARFPATP